MEDTGHDQKEVLGDAVKHDKAPSEKTVAGEGATSQNRPTTHHRRKAEEFDTGELGVYRRKWQVSGSSGRDPELTFAHL